MAEKAAGKAGEAGRSSAFEAEPCDVADGAPVVGIDGETDDEAIATEAAAVFEGWKARSASPVGQPILIWRIVFVFKFV
jgi:hypothetical protein